MKAQFPNSSRRKPRSLVYYVMLLLMFGACIWLILATGSKLNTHRSVVPSPEQLASPTTTANTGPASQTPEAFAGRIFRTYVRSPLGILLFQIIVIIAAARLFGALFRKIGQPVVMGEMMAGLMLGPSALGLLSPPALEFLFPPSSLPTLSLLSQIGVLLFMFIVGMELDIQHLRERVSAAVMVSHAGIIVPFILGAALSLVLFSPLAPANTSFAPFALFMGIAMSITAFPVLARILEDRGLSQSRLGSIALACAAIDDVSAWCILAVVIAIVKSSGLMASMLTIILTLLFTAIMIFVVKPRLGDLIKSRIGDPKRARGLLAGVLAFVFASAWFTESIGIHALFGSFLAGAVMPSLAGFRIFLKERLESFSSAALLPLFFVFTGLRTQVSSLNDWTGWLICLGIIIVAVAGKLGGSMLMARWIRMNWHDSFSLGVLMNTRGLVELIVLNIGYDLGILSARIFVMMVIMALVTTFMTAPLLSLVNWSR